MTTRRYLLASLLMLALSGAICAEDAARKVDDEAFGGWERLRKSNARSFVAKGRIFQDHPELKHGPKTISFVWKQNGDWALCEIVDPTKIPGDRFQFKEVQATNSKYSFQALDKGKGWAIGAMDQSANRALPVKHFIKTVGLNYLESAWMVEGYTFPEAMKEPGFVVRDYSRLHEGADAGLAQFVFSIPERPKPAPPGKEGMEEAVVKLDPKHDWRIVEYRANLRVGKDTGLVERTIEYEPQGGFVRRVDQTATFNGTFKVVSKITTDAVEFRDIPESEFSLSAYGLPEPGDTPVKQPSSWPWYVWLLGVGLALLLAAILFRVLLSRKNAAPQS
ncbi:MAG: hypothetical protein K2W96_22825 [Gemmataceae bacterium]|nr:hypothetical protein [Gemmataceae bacterium]